jgi:hypothetical protein
VRSKKKGGKGRRNIWLLVGSVYTEIVDDDYQRIIGGEYTEVLL